MSSGYEEDVTNSGGSQSDDQTSEDKPKSKDNSKNHSEDEDDILTLDEEEMMQRLARKNQGPRGRRLSSLDLYLLQPKEEPISYVLKSKETLQDVIEEVNEFEKKEANKLTEEERRRVASDQKRAEIIMARLEKNDDKRRESVLRDLFRARLEKVENRTSAKKFKVLTPEKRARLKELLMKKAKEEFRNEQREQMRAKENYLQKVCPPINMDNMNDAYKGPPCKSITLPRRKVGMGRTTGVTNRGAITQVSIPLRCSLPPNKIERKFKFQLPQLDVRIYSVQGDSLSNSRNSRKTGTIFRSSAEEGEEGEKEIKNFNYRRGRRREPKIIYAWLGVVDILGLQIH
ncbi:hypothetical protein Aperf_G00000029020 [Anoplocephala perfoliata]